MAKRTMNVWRGGPAGGDLHAFLVDVDPGMVVLDVLHRIQATQANDLAVRWNCKAGRCGSCSMEVNGRPGLACMTRMNSFPPDAAVTVRPMKAFPVVKDLVTDVSWNYEVNRRIPPFKIAEPRPGEPRRMYQEDADRVQEFRKCIECFLCQDVCHILRDREGKAKFVGPRFMVRLASLEMHPLDVEDRIPRLRDEFGSGMCNITKCCTEVCPESIRITDNAIIPLKERVVDRYYDPVLRLARKVFRPKEAGAGGGG